MIMLTDGEHEPTEQDIKDWYSWDLMKDHLAIRHPCPCCGKSRTRWIGREWNICYDCLIGFTMTDMIPVGTPDMVSDYQAKLMQSDRSNNEANRWEELAYVFENIGRG